MNLLEFQVIFLFLLITVCVFSRKPVDSHFASKRARERRKRRVAIDRESKERKKTGRESKVLNSISLIKETFVAKCSQIRTDGSKVLECLHIIVPSSGARNEKCDKNTIRFFRPRYWSASVFMWLRSIALRQPCVGQSSVLSPVYATVYWILIDQINFSQSWCH